MVYAILHKFEIQDRVWGVVCDNASNNANMMNCFAKLKMHWLTGPKARIHCLPHILNLTSKAIAMLFITKWAKLEKPAPSTQCTNKEASTLSDEEAGSEGNDGNATEHEIPHDDASVTKDYDSNEEDETGEDDGTAPLRALEPDELDDKELSDIVIPPEITGSINAKELKALHKALYKYSLHFKKLFIEMCEAVDVTLSHNVQQDVVTRWNSTKLMIEDALRLEEAIHKFQKNPIYLTENGMTRPDFKVMKHLLKLLKPLLTLTEIMSKSHIPMLADILVHFDSLNGEFCTMALDTSLPLWVQEAANHTGQVLNKYYAITETLIMYQLAILLHPSNHEAYLRHLSWPDEWIESAHQALMTTWETYYKPEGYDNGADDTSSQSQFGYLSFMDEVYGSLAEESERALDPVTAFIEGKPVIERTKLGKSKPVNLLNWWYTQRLVGEEHNRLTQMALDILTTPVASSVEVERAFLFVSNLVSKRQHSMSAFTIQAMATLGVYSCADLVPSSVLEKAHRKACEQNQANAWAKVAKAKAKAAVTEAKALATEQDRSEDEQTKGEETEDNEDVLHMSSDIKDADIIDND
ncbi:hypothetical protein FRC11_007494 [Ceratobasidium sp. 423]|nr:hypothetical protein FRC11_007494 [Ceratobasidium sp. 423]